MNPLAEFECEGLQVRRAAASGFDLSDDGQFTGRAVPDGAPAELGPGLWEQFTRGAVAAQAKDPARVKIAHRHGEIIGRAMSLEERDDGLYVLGRIDTSGDIAEARTALAQLRGELVDEMSVGFKTVRNGFIVEPYKGGTLVTHRRAALREISVVPWGAYGRKATVAAVRTQPDRWRVLLEKIEALRVQ